jgi:hypothetical protein
MKILQSLSRFMLVAVSFCDFKISEINFHISRYGYYGLGLSKQWGIEKQLNPVLYINKDNKYFQDFRQCIIAIDKNVNEMEISKITNNTSAINNCNQTILKIYCYLKYYQGLLLRKNGIKIDNFRFADDREWRYIPDIVPPFENNKNTKEEQNKKIMKTHYLPFEYKDIKFIFIRTELECIDLINYISSLRISRSLMDSLISKIIVVDHLDFMKYQK